MTKRQKGESGVQGQKGEQGIRGEKGQKGDGSGVTYMQWRRTSRPSVLGTQLVYSMKVEEKKTFTEG